MKWPGGAKIPKNHVRMVRAKIVPRVAGGMALHFQKL
jgi:hypothetical protein